MLFPLQLLVAFLAILNCAQAFAPVSKQQQTSFSKLAAQHQTSPSDSQVDAPSTRRNFFNGISAAVILTSVTVNSFPAFAEEEEEVRTVQTPLYSILRVREAAEQESRLIKTGKFKDVQRANVKLAVKFMVENYRLNDNFIAASGYLIGEKRIKAGEIGQTVVQNLFTILEYFDASDVQNIKVGSAALAGKEKIVLDGLQATRKGIDDFLSYFPKDDVLAVVTRIESENSLNEKEFDKELNQGSGILNLKPTQS
eukprot:scaffold1290_cov230-Chaetoceros_neogracile.AAC.2